MLFYIESNLTLLEGKLARAKIATTPANFIKLITSVIYKPYRSERVTATFVTEKHLLTAAGFLFDNDYDKQDIDKSKRIKPAALAIGTSFLADLLQVTEIYNQVKPNKNDYEKEPAILQVSYCVKGL